MLNRRPLTLLLAVLLLVVGLHSAPAKETLQQKAERSFTQIVTKHFRKWDRNWDGRISAGEIDRLIKDPSVTGLEAAAVASIHRYLRSDDAPPAITQGELLTKSLQQPALLEQGNNQETVRHDQNDGKPRFITYYARFATHVKKAPRDLFASEAGPTLEGVKQGALGDCFFMCVIGATINRDPATIRRMLRPNADGTTDVTFPAVGTVRVRPLTDAEIALTSSAADQGNWINVLEKAFGEVKYAHPETKRSNVDIDLDVISRGGKILTAVQLMTGHRAFVVPIRKYKNKHYHLLTDAEMPRMMKRLDTLFTSVLATNRLICADIAPGTPGKDIPPGLVGRHAYAVLGYDQSRQIVTVWNPHGKNYTPKNFPAGIENGYPVKGGVFQVPLDEFVRVFKAVTYETTKPLDPA